MTMVESHKKVVKFCNFIRSQEVKQEDRDRLFKPKVVEELVENKDDAMEFEWDSIQFI